MYKILKNSNILFLLIISLNQIILAFLLNSVYPVHFIQLQPLFMDLIRSNLSIPTLFIYPINMLNLVLIWLIGKRLFSSKKSLIPVLIFACSPWSIYLVVAQSFYIYLLCFILMQTLGILLLKSKKNWLGVTLFVTGSVLSLYSSLLYLTIFPIILGLIVLKFVSLRELKLSFFLILFFCLPLIFYSLKNIEGIKNIFSNQVSLYSDPGLINSVNKLQGESRKTKFGFLARLVENKYLYTGEYTILKVLKNITPTIYFTPQERLLGFSFSSPILVGFIIPFLYGLFILLSSTSLRKYLILSLFLVVPSVLSKSYVDLNRLILFEPVIILITTFGLIQLSSLKVYRKLLYLIIILVVFQLQIVIFDINHREFFRFERYHSINFEIGK